VFSPPLEDPPIGLNQGRPAPANIDPSKPQDRDPKTSCPHNARVRAPIGQAGRIRVPVQRGRAGEAAAQAKACRAGDAGLISELWQLRSRGACPGRRAIRPSGCDCRSARCPVWRERIHASGDGRSVRAAPSVPDAPRRARRPSAATLSLTSPTCGGGKGWGARCSRRMSVPTDSRSGAAAATAGISGSARARVSRAKESFGVCRGSSGWRISRSARAAEATAAELAIPIAWKAIRRRTTADQSHQGATRSGRDRGQCSSGRLLARSWSRPRTALYEEDAFSRGLAPPSS